MIGFSREEFMDSLKDKSLSELIVLLTTLDLEFSSKKNIIEHLMAERIEYEQK